MKLRFISPTLHGLIDYGAAVGLILIPLALGLGDSSPIALWFSVATGVAVIVVSVLTNYRYGIIRTIPFDGHLTIDLLAATAFMAAPFLFGFEGLDAHYYWINAAVVYLVVALTENKDLNTEQ
ncbi:MAG: hypothetical protein HEP71_34065 [Roseivirga sp.]|nr:hypothetical protein [Roseivirga sp.]